MEYCSRSSEALAFHAQGSVQCIVVLQSVSDEALELSVQEFVLLIAVLLVVRLSHCLRKALHS